MKCASLHTFEVDNPEVAVQEIQDQLSGKLDLLAHAAGVVMCNPEFIESGVLQAVAESLPFELAGVTTASQAVNDDLGEFILTIFVLTSDDVQFVAGVTESVAEDVDGPVRGAYAAILAQKQHPGKPGLALVFPPFGLHAGDRYVQAWENVIPGVPLFGTCSIDDNADFSECETIHNGRSHKGAMAYLLCYGDVNPRFLIATLTKVSPLSTKAEVTKGSASCVNEINHMSAFDFFDEFNYTESVTFTPFMIDFLKRDDYDGVPVIRGHAAFTDDGSAIFYGDVHEGSTITIMLCDPDDIEETTRQKLEEVNEMPDVNGVLLFPCVVRRAALIGANKPLLELESARSTIRPDIPYMMGYAGGEICPTSMRDGVPTNRFHNYSLVILVL